MIRYCMSLFVLVVLFYFVLNVAAYVDKVSKSPDGYGDAMKTECRKVE
jgi:hypothetical protein